MITTFELPAVNLGGEIVPLAGRISLLRRGEATYITSPVGKIPWAVSPAAQSDAHHYNPIPGP